MRGKTNHQGSLFFSINMEDRIRPDHPLRPIKRAVEASGRAPMDIIHNGE